MMKVFKLPTSRYSGAIYTSLMSLAVETDADIGRTTLRKIHDKMPEGSLIVFKSDEPRIKTKLGSIDSRAIVQVSTAYLKELLMEYATRTIHSDFNPGWVGSFSHNIMDIIQYMHEEDVDAMHIQLPTKQRYGWGSTPYLSRHFQKQRTYHRLKNFYEAFNEEDTHRSSYVLLAEVNNLP
jgi:hypothetical protein